MLLLLLLLRAKKRGLEKFPKRLSNDPCAVAAAAVVVERLAGNCSDGWGSSIGRCSSINSTRAAIRLALATPTDWLAGGRRLADGSWYWHWHCVLTAAAITGRATTTANNKQQLVVVVVAVAVAVVSCRQSARDRKVPAQPSD